MASYLLFDSLLKRTNNTPFLNKQDKRWLVETINKHMNVEGKEKLYSLLVIYNKQHPQYAYDPKEPYYDIEKLSPSLQKIWYEFAKMHVKLSRPSAGNRSAASPSRANHSGTSPGGREASEFGIRGCGLPRSAYAPHFLANQKRAVGD
jgi:hypothetical protein